MTQWWQNYGALKFVLFFFLEHSLTLTRNIFKAILSECLSVCPSCSGILSKYGSHFTASLVKKT